MDQEFGAGLSENVPSSQAYSEDQFSRYTGIALALEQWKLALPISRLSFQLCTNVCERKGCFTRVYMKLHSMKETQASFFMEPQWRVQEVLFSPKDNLRREEDRLLRTDFSMLPPVCELE
jgi:hypothetical protein